MTVTGVDVDEKALEGKILELWHPLTPHLDSSSIEILKFYVLNVNQPFTLYRVSRELGLSFSLVYKKGRRLSYLRLLESLGDGRFRANVKSCIAAFTHEAISFKYLLNCVKTVWGLEEFNDKSVVSFLALLALGLSAREFNIITGNICYFDEAALHIMRLYRGIVDFRVPGRKCVVSGGSSSERFGRDFISSVSELLGLPEDVVVNALALASKGVFRAIPPTIKTATHNILLTIRDGRFRVILVECKGHSCPYYWRSLGLECPRVVKEVEASLRSLPV